VAELGLNGPRAQEAGLTGLGEDLVQWGGGLGPLVGAGHRRRFSPRVR
jgi:hypothetical protein